MPPADPAPRCLVTGATGYIGSRLVAELARHDVPTVATARDPDKLGHFGFPEQVGRVALDVAHERSCAEAFTAAAEHLGGPVTTAYFLVHSIGEGDFAAQDLESARVFAAAARDAGVARLVYLGGFVPGGEHLSEHLESRADVGDALGGAGVDLVWLRAAIILGAGSTSYELIRHVADRLPVVPVPRWMDHPVSPIAVDDVLRYLRAAADPARVPAGAYDVACGESPTYAGLLEAYADAHGLRRRWLRVPAVPPALAARVASWLTPLPHALTADLVLSLPNTMATREHRLADLVDGPGGRPTTIAEAFRRATRPDPVRDTWSTPDPLQLTTTDPDWAR